MAYRIDPWEAQVCQLLGLGDDASFAALRSLLAQPFFPLHRFPERLVERLRELGLIHGISSTRPAAAPASKAKGVRRKAAGVASPGHPAAAVAPSSEPDPGTYDQPDLLGSL